MRRAEPSPSKASTPATGGKPVELETVYLQESLLAVSFLCLRRWHKPAQAVLP